MRYWIGVASKEHVQHGLRENFCALCHGKERPLRRMQEGDWLIYYSSRERFSDKIPYQCFTAIGTVGSADQIDLREVNGVLLNQRPVTYLQGLHDAPIRPLLTKLSFVTNPAQWGYKFRFGHFEITKQDFELIKHAMETK